MSNDLYAPPQSSVGGPTPAELSARANGELVYAGFWQRFGALVIDSLIVGIPMIGLDLLFGGMSRMYALFMLVPMLIVLWYMNIVMVCKQGATPGKLCLGIHVSMRDGATVGLKSALLRYAFMAGITVWGQIQLAYGAMQMTDETFKGLSYVERNTAIDALVPYSMTPSILLMGWALISIVTVVATREKRSLHDYMAGTVVVQT
jgi:uncharacterized RDD family membrane protein YckC